MGEILLAACISIKYYLPAWLAGILVGFLVATLAWLGGARTSKYVYLTAAGLSFLPVTVLMPYFLQVFGLNWFIYPLLVLPVSLSMAAAFHETFIHTNRHRLTLIRNYGMRRIQFIHLILIRESLPGLHSALRFTLSLSFAVFVALDYFMESWGGLGAQVRFHYNRASFPDGSHRALMGLTVLIAWILGGLQVAILRRLLAPLIEFRKHY